MCCHFLPHSGVFPSKQRKTFRLKVTIRQCLSVADLRGTPPGVQILSISCSFWRNLAKSCVAPPPPGEIVDPPLPLVTL